MNPSVPPTAPPITAPETLDPELGVTEAVGDGVDVDRGAVEESRMFRSLKYSNWSGRSQKVGSNFPCGHVELFIHGSSLQQPQNVGACSQVQKGVCPPHEPPGDWLSSAVDRPAGRRLLPWHPFVHGSAIQHPTNLVPVSHAYLIVSENHFCKSARKLQLLSLNGWHSRVYVVSEAEGYNVPFPFRWAEKLTRLSGPVCGVRHLEIYFWSFRVKLLVYIPGHKHVKGRKKKTRQTVQKAEVNREIGKHQQDTVHPAVHNCAPKTAKFSSS